MRSLTSIGLVLAVLIFALPVIALDVPLASPLRVNDYARVLTIEQRRAIDSGLAAYEKATSHQIVVAIFPSLEVENLEAYSMRLAEAWKVGQAGKDNGVIVVVFLQDRKIRIEVGYGLEGALPDAVCKRIIDEEIAPRFRQQDYFGGLSAALVRIGATIGPPALAIAMPRPLPEPASRAVSPPRLRPRETVFEAVMFTAIMIAFILAVILIPFFILRSARRGRGWSSGGSRRYRSSRSSSRGYRGGGGRFGGGGASGGW